MGHQEKCPTVIIEDIPSTEDDFGAHKRVADAICEIICSDEPGGKMIGLEGGWGSGKSTVINILRKTIEDKNYIQLFYFDAWAHEGDPLRRTFLESLIKFFQKKEWIDIDNWNKTIDELAKRRKITNTKTVPKITNLGKWFSTSLFLTPLGIVFISYALNKGVTIDWKLPFSIPFIIGIIIFLAPIWVLLGNKIAIKFKKKKAKKNQIQKEKNHDVLNWAFLAGNSITETEQNTTETPEPTSIEFEDCFEKLMREALEKKERKAIIVLDNLDRVEATYALSIWSTLQTFLQDRSFKAEEWYKKIWIIIPYDPTGIRQLWQKDDKSNDNKDKKGKNVVAKSFIDKSFQLKFEVPPFVLSNWKTLLIKLLRTALPGPIHSDENKFNQIYQIYNLCIEDADTSPTPRELKVFVNSIGSIHRQWEDKIPLSDVAYYVLLKRQMVDVKKALTEGKNESGIDFPDPNILSILSPDVKKNLAGLIFNVEARIGYQILLNDPIKNSLFRDESDDIKTLEELHKSGFWAVLESISSIDFYEFSETSLLKTARCLLESELLKNNSSSPEIQTIKRNLERCSEKIAAWHVENESFSGICSLLQIISNEKFSRNIISKIRVEPIALEPENDITNELNDLTSKIISNLIKVYQTAKDLNQENIVDVFKLPFTPIVWASVCSVLIKIEEKEIWKNFKTQNPFEQISIFLISKISSGLFTDTDYATIKVSNTSFGNAAKWTPIIQAIEARFHENNNIVTPEARYLLEGLYLLKFLGNDEADQSLSQLADSGLLLHSLARINEKNTASENESRGWCIAAFWDNKPDLDTPKNIGVSQTGYNYLIKIFSEKDNVLAQNVLEKLKEIKRLNVLFEIIDSRKAFDPFIIECLKIVADSDYYKDLYTSQELIKRWKELHTHLNDDDGNAGRFNTLVLNLCQNLDLKDVITTGKFIIDDCEFYKILIKESNFDRTVIDWCIEGLKSINKEEWYEQIIKTNYALRLLIYLMELSLDIDIKLTTPFEDAIIMYTKEIILSKGEISNYLENNWQKIINCLQPEIKNDMLNGVLSAAMERDGDIPKAYFDLWGKALLNDKTLHSENYMVRDLLLPILEKKSDYSLLWLKGLLQHDKNILKIYVNIDKNSVSSFEIRIKDLLKEFAKEEHEETEEEKIIKEIANILNITVPKEKENEANEDGERKRESE